jgi:hypothetical protein
MNCLSFDQFALDGHLPLTQDALQNLPWMADQFLHGPGHVAVSAVLISLASCATVHLDAEPNELSLASLSKNCPAATSAAISATDLELTCVFNDAICRTTRNHQKEWNVENWRTHRAPEDMTSGTPKKLMDSRGGYFDR